MLNNYPGYSVKVLYVLLLMAVCVSCHAQTKKDMGEDKTNPLLCDTATGICEVPGEVATGKQESIPQGARPVKIIYYTDPICSSCWGIEPQLRKLKLEYGDYLDIEYRMGGLLPDWSYNSGGISKPGDVAHHWDDVSKYYEMPIDGDVWLEDPLDSSYPLCIAMKAAQIQDEDKAVTFMRIMRERLYLDKKNMAKWDNMADAAIPAGLDVARLKSDFEGRARKLFQEDLDYAQKLGVRGFPTMFFSDGKGQQLTVFGAKPFVSYEKAVLAIYPDAKKKPVDSSNPMALFTTYPTLTVKEYAVILDKTTADAQAALEQLLKDGLVGKKVIKNGALYIKK